MFNLKQMGGHQSIFRENSENAIMAAIFCDIYFVIVAMET